VGPRGAGRAWTAFEASGWRWAALKSGSAPFDTLLAQLGEPGAPWAGQMQRVREWYAPILERRYDAPEVRAGDLVQLERIAATYGTREAFLTELALDPPAASSDLAGDPHLDEDYLVLSTVHSAKGQEWEAVHVLNVVDGSFPSEFATGRPESIEEERRLLYVAMTRAKTGLDLITPLKFYVTQQSRIGDRHVYGAKSRFLTRAVMKCFEEIVFGEPVNEEPRLAAAPAVDVAGRLRGMWG
jgi:DNA helicase-2/ATP-dependent DNA helicase PcrA